MIKVSEKRLRRGAAVVFALVAVGAADAALAQPVAAPAASSGLTAAPTAAAAGCRSPEFSEFDFWIGNWASYDEKGVLQGYNRVEKVADGCVLQEWYIGLDGAVGSSFTIYDRSRRVWNQTFVSNHGTLLPIEGYKVGEAVILIGPHTGADGKVQLHRTVWTPTPDGVHQVWDFSRDGGRTWEINYDGHLRRTDKVIDKHAFDRP